MTTLKLDSRTAKNINSGFTALSEEDAIVKLLENLDANYIMMSKKENGDYEIMLSSEDAAKVKAFFDKANSL